MKQLVLICILLIVVPALRTVYVYQRDYIRHEQREIDRDSLHMIYHENLAELQALIEQGANPDVSFSGLKPEVQEGFSLLHAAVESENVEAVEYLLSYGVLVNARSYYDETPLSIAVGLQASSPDAVYSIVRLLLEHGADPNAVVLRDTEFISVRQLTHSRDLLSLLDTYGASDDGDALLVQWGLYLARIGRGVVTEAFNLSACM